MSNEAALQEQLADVFGQAGWHIEGSDAVLGTDKKPPNGRTLYLRANINQDWATLVRRALTQAGVSFTERQEAVVTNITCPQILLSGPYEPARWG